MLAGLIRVASATRGMMTKDLAERMKRLSSSWLVLILLLTAGSVWASDRDFLAAQDAYKKGNLTVLAQYADSMKADPLGVYPRYWLLDSQLGAMSVQPVQAFFDAYPGTWLAEKLRGNWLRVLGTRKDWADFRVQYPLLQQAPPDDLLCYNFQARIDAGDKQALPEARVILWFSPKELPPSCNPVLDALVANNTVIEADMWARLRLAFEANNPGLIEYLSKLLNEEVPAATISHIGSNPAGYLNNAPTTTRMQRELVIYALSRLTRTDLDGTASQLLRLEQGLGNVESYAWRMLAVSAARNGDPRALAWFKNSAELPYNDSQQEWRIRAALRVQDWDTVALAINGLSAQGRTDRAWQYWRARALEAHKEGPDADIIYADLSKQDDYYGLLARDSQHGPVMQAPTPVPYKVTDADLAQLKGNAGLQRALLLYELGATPEGDKEWNWALRGADDHLLLAAAEQANAVGWYDRAIFAAERTQTLHNDELRYLAPYRDITRSYAQDLGLDEAWIYGLMRQESRFASAAKSGVGAHGLMQLMPDTARWVARKLHLHYHPTMTDQIGGNVQLGTFYLKHVLDSLDDNEVLATAAYNAGPGRARQWQAATPLEAAIYVEGIPFFETRDYVRKVMTNAVYYSRNFGKSRQTLTQRMGVIPARGTVPLQGP